MRAPRMRVAVFGTSNAGRLLAVEMRTAGHTVEALSDLSELGNYQALIVAELSQEDYASVYGGDVLANIGEER